MTAAEAPSPTLEPVPEDWDRALAVVAHPDDLEYGVASAVARWTDQGKTVTYCLLTAGEAGIDALPPDQCARIRMEEERRSAAVVGVDTVEFLGHPDGLVEANLAVRRRFDRSSSQGHARAPCCGVEQSGSSSGS